MTELALSPQEAQLLYEQASTDQVTIDPGGDEPGQLWHQLTVALHAHSKAERAILRLRPLIGKLLLIFRDRPELYRGRYKKYGVFIDEFVVKTMGLGRSSLYACRVLADRLPGLSPEIYEELGVRKLNALAAFSKSSDPSFPEYLEMARSCNAREFEAWAENGGHVVPGQLKFRTILIYTNENIAGEWEEFRNDPAIQSRVGTTNEGEILSCMMAECLSSGWKDPGQA